MRSWDVLHSMGTSPGCPSQEGINRVCASWVLTHRLMDLLDIYFVLLKPNAQTQPFLYEVERGTVSRPSDPKNSGRHLASWLFPSLLCGSQDYLDLMLFLPPYSVMTMFDGKYEKQKKPTCDYLWVNSRQYSTVCKWDFSSGDFVPV